MVAISQSRAASLAAYRAHETRRRLAAESAARSARLTAAAERAHVTRRLMAGTITEGTAIALRAHITRRLDAVLAS